MEAVRSTNKVGKRAILKERKRKKEEGNENRLPEAHGEKKESYTWPGEKTLGTATSGGVCIGRAGKGPEWGGERGYGRGMRTTLRAITAPVRLWWKEGWVHGKLGTALTFKKLRS